MYIFIFFITCVLHTVNGFKSRMKKAKIELKTSKTEIDLTNESIECEMEKLEKEIRQNRIKKEMLLLEIRRNHRMLGMD